MGLLCVIYVGMAALGLSLDAVSGIATVVWPPTGIALAALTLYGARFWPGIALGALLINLWVWRSGVLRQRSCRREYP